MGMGNHHVSPPFGEYVLPFPTTLSKSKFNVFFVSQREPEAKHHAHDDRGTCFRRHQVFVGVSWECRGKGLLGCKKVRINGF